MSLEKQILLREGEILALIYDYFKTVMLFDIQMKFAIVPRALPI